MQYNGPGIARDYRGIAFLGEISQFCGAMTDQDVRDKLIRYAEQYETEDFINGDPSWFMHQVSGNENQEAMAFLASAFSYGSRKQFLPKVQQFLDWSGGEVHDWLLDGRFNCQVKPGDNSCFYRLNTCAQVNKFLASYQALLQQDGTLGKSIRDAGISTAIEAVKHICARLGGAGSPIPQDAASACKRVCMFLRWMVRDSSPVDLGLWAGFIDKRSLIIPMDTHVLQEAEKLGLIKSRTASMNAALRLSKTLAEVFPDDPMKGDFALFGYGVAPI